MVKRSPRLGYGWKKKNCSGQLDWLFGTAYDDPQQGWYCPLGDILEI